MSTNIKVSTAQLLFARSEQMGLRPAWLLPNELFAVQTESGERYVHYALSVMNSQVSSSLTKNKLLTRLILERHGLPNIPFLNPADLAAAEQFLSTHGKIIVKPLKGSNSRDVHIVESPDQLADKDVAQYILEKYIAGRELRFLVLNGTIIGVHRSDYGVSVAETRDLARISYTQSDWDPTLMAMSLTVAGIFKLQYAAVDYLIDDEGQAHILEVNSSPGMHLFHAPTSGPPVDVAHQFLQAMLATA